jgi:hypothetical protein
VSERRSFVARMTGAMLLDADTYEEVEADTSAIGQATLIVALVAVGGALGSWWLHAVHRGIPLSVALLPVVLEVLEPLVLWVGCSFFAYAVGATFFRGPETETDFREVLRTVGFAFTPALFRIVAFLMPGIQSAFGLGDSAAPRVVLAFVLETWVLVAGVVAVRQALDFTTLRGLGTFGLASLLLITVVNGLGATLESPPEIVLVVLDLLRAIF